MGVLIPTTLLPQLLHQGHGWQKFFYTSELSLAIYSSSNSSVCTLHYCNLTFSNKIFTSQFKSAFNVLCSMQRFKLSQRNVTHNFTKSFSNFFPKYSLVEPFPSICRVTMGVQLSLLLLPFLFFSALWVVDIASVKEVLPSHRSPSITARRADTKLLLVWHLPPLDFSFFLTDYLIFCGLDESYFVVFTTSISTLSLFLH